MKLVNILLTVFLLGASVAQARAGEGTPVYPGAEWTTKEPEQVGQDLRKLKELSDYAGGLAACGTALGG